MSKALNLSDMLWQRNGAAGPERAKDAGTAQAASRAAAKRPRADFIPAQPAPAAPGADKGGSVKTFRERVKESQDRIARREHAFFKQPGRPEAAQAEAAKARPAKTQGAEDAARPDAAAPVRPQGPSRTASRRTEAKDGATGAEQPAADQAAAPEAVAGEGAQGAHSAPDLRPESRRHGADSRGEAAHGARDAMDSDALEARLEELGLEATPEQLRDPAFLAEMLWQIDGIPMGLPLFPETAPSDVVSDALTAVEGIPEAGIDASAAETLPSDAEALAPLPFAGDEGEAAAAAAPAPSAPRVDQAPSAAQAAASSFPGRQAPAAVPDAGLASFGTAAPEAAGDEAAPVPETFDWTAVDEPEREEIAALLRDRLAGIADETGMRSGPEGARAEAPDLPAAVQLARAGADRPMAAPAPAPAADPVLADPDRLRVLQNAGVEDALSRENALLALERDLEAVPSSEAEDAETQGAEGDALPENAFRASAKDASGDSRRDQPGRGDAEARPDAFGGRETAAAPKESVATPFQSSLESVRASEARLAQAKAPVPHAHAPMEPSVLAQIARKLSALGPRSAEEIRIQLEPEHLGKVRIAIELRGEGLTARISVENDAVRQMVDQNLASLKESLENQGVKIQGMEVSVEQRHASLFNPDGSNAREFFHRRGREAAAAEAGAEAAGEAAEADTGRRMGYNTMEYIA